jgi:UDP-N-acetylmuramoyl-tripeptide--D-alanyl-D-alanine ligase
VETFGSGGEWFPDVEGLIRRLQAELSPGVTVLIKGSRVNRLERVVQALGGGGGSSHPMTRAS